MTIQYFVPSYILGWKLIKQTLRQDFICFVWWLVLSATVNLIVQSIPPTFGLSCTANSLQKISNIQRLYIKTYKILLAIVYPILFFKIFLLQNVKNMFQTRWFKSLIWCYMTKVKAWLCHPNRGINLCKAGY